ncbi:hypothetical protein BMI86_07980 [Thioclava sp. DLFJ5-1]|uniref:tyrosine-type recombinase/integrase n=1 Tax=Thioclava sp. DLFJ5-1 TaxID=1915314 RepID=UPI000998BB1B|nr:tyrosine-type recombinase/integrase [Thioclava sp. DLFJ5-1]OOY20471.1 hypothetical protein BMI86_07980 [Thioclava sp. DLFJ5-1]
MARRIKLSKATIERLDFEKDGQWVTDTEVPQLLVRIYPTSKRYVTRWTSAKDGKRKQEVIGDVADMSVATARDRARKLVANDRAREVETLGDVFAEWEERHARKVSVAHAEEIRRTWRKHIEPDLGKMKLGRITHRVLQDWYDKKRREHPVTPSGRPQAKPNSAATVRRWIAYISKLLAIARTQGWMTGNPAEGLEMSTPHRRLDVFTQEDVQELSEALTAHHARFPIGVELIRMLLLFPCRGVEAREMQWGDLDLKVGTWTIPASRYKTHKDKVFPLGPLQVKHLESIPRRSEKYVFPMVTDYARPCAKSHQRHVWETLRPKPLGIHALRKTIATMLLNKQVPLEMVSLMLGHSSTLVTQQAYAHLNPQAARQHLEKWGAILEDDLPEEDDPEMRELLEAQASIARQIANRKRGAG